jgi:HlyD family secretion protein
VVDVLTSDAVRIQPGAAVHIDRWGGPTLNAVVRLIEPSAFTRISSLGVEEQRVNAVMDLRSAASEWAALGDGYRVEAHIVVWRGDSVLQVPASAVFRHDSGWAVFAVRAGVAHLQSVQVGQRGGLSVQIVSGLSEGEQVVTHPSDRVTEGVKVTPH